jgi:ABC-type glycerol-3-phosphate transport system substrate-binding protein
MGSTLFIPEVEGGVSYSNIGGENLAIRKDSGKEEQAKQLVKFLLREENITKLIGQNFAAIKSIAKVPTHNPVTGEVYSDVVRAALATVLQQLDTASARPAVKGWAKVNDMYLANALADIIENGANIQNALDTAVAQAGRVLEF